MIWLLLTVLAVFVAGILYLGYEIRHPFMEPPSRDDADPISRRNGRRD